MTVENHMKENDVSLDRFPVGMRVLAVDDDPTCLKVLESLLRKCQYQVTTTNQAIKALKMLRENRNMVDLVISDVNMPDMDGFKLLELVGLEMDLPVIMLSAHSDTNLVMEGITHGACDYLLKPVRIEELKNIWQHVVRRKKSDPMNRSRSGGHDRAFVETSEGGENGAGSSGNVDQNSKFNRKRKDQDEDEEELEESEDDGRESEDPGAQKKPRIVWSTDLHKKFVDAVQQLGYEKAFPKKILDMMNVEGLTRENVASHLQKYRQFLKRLDAAERLKASGNLGVKDFSYMRTGALNHSELGDLRSLSQPIRLANTALSPSVSHVGMLGRLNSPGGFTMRGIASSAGITQPLPTNSFNAIAATGKFQPPSLFQGFPSPLASNPTGFASLAGFQGAKSTFGGSSSNDVSNSLSSPLMLQSLGIQSSVRPSPSSLQSSDLGISGSSNFLDYNRCNEPWQNTAVQSSTFVSNNSAVPSAPSQLGNSPHGFSSPSALLAPLPDSRDLQGRDGLIGNIVPSNNFTTRQPWEGGFSNSHNLDQHFSAFNSFNNNPCNKDSTASIFDQLNGSSASIFPSNEIEKSATETIEMKPNDDNSLLFSQVKPHDALIPNYDSLDDILSTLMKRDQNETALMNGGEFGFDNYPLGSCM